MHIELTQIVKAPREKVFQAFTDFEAWPKFSTIYTRVTVEGRAGNTVSYDTEVKFRGRMAKRTEKLIMTPAEEVQEEWEMEGMTGTTMWKFESVPEGTRLTAVADARLKGMLLVKVLGPLAKRWLIGRFRKETQAFATFVETK